MRALIEGNGVAARAVTPFLFTTNKSKTMGMNDDGFKYPAHNYGKEPSDNKQNQAGNLTPEQRLDHELLNCVLIALENNTEQIIHLNDLLKVDLMVSSQGALNMNQKLTDKIKVILGTSPK